MTPPPHSHCPDGCEHPQPVKLADGRELCGRCLSRGEEVEVVACNVETCPEDEGAKRRGAKKR